MHSLLKTPDKTRPLIVLLLIVFFVMINNLDKRKDFADLDRAVASIYQDRLMPSGYIFRLNNHLHEKFSGIQAGNQVNPGQLLQHNAAINVIIQQYEKTYLTQSEKQQWLRFKRQLEEYNTAEQKLLALSRDQSRNLLSLQQAYALTQHSLERLSALQLEEGNNLQKRSRSIIGGSMLNTYLDISLLFILVVVILLVSGTKGGRFEMRHPRNPLLN